MHFCNRLEVKETKIVSVRCYFWKVESLCLWYILNVPQVSLSTWDEGSVQPCQDYLVSVDLSSANMRNPFSEKKWRKFQISRLFGSSNAAIKLHVIDVNLYQGATRVVDRWLLVLSLGSGQTRNMALDRYVQSKIFCDILI